ncbi:interferon-induced very large GTPase 1-like [Ornithorhynchus anatinus]|uniref:VLIG-type G domain-containing protein n=1 Tax=Ornithorhynchus anatinus TaxID=9258 RepID=F7AHI5_ORNAN|nr:interferon-induced very large GTPase 1-like [Ornithorhynchus anatinus]XP_028913660.1 interferon-induced very large GTPase 1-like [Ornithorhynchus anatinus]XP_028913661.1 interferon-induced very large GTPase 1-like [Ornithorhynchus anatinus]
MASQPGPRRPVWIPRGLNFRWNLPIIESIFAPRLAFLLPLRDAVSQQMSPWIVIPSVMLSLLTGRNYFLWEQHRIKAMAAPAELPVNTCDRDPTERDLARRLSIGEPDAEPWQLVLGESHGATSLRAPQDSTLNKEGDLTVFLEDVKSWEVTDPEKQLKKLVDFMHNLNEQTKNDNAWFDICLSDRAVQDFLVNTATVCKDLPPQDTRLTRSHLRLLLDPHVHSVPNFPQASWLLQWVCNPVEMQQPRTDPSEFADFIQILKEIQNSVLRMDLDSVSPALMEEAQKQATAAVGSALSSLLQTLRATGRSDMELLFLSIAAAAGYVAESQTFGDLVGWEEINFLLQEMPKAHETHLALRRQCGPKAQAFLVLTGLTVTSGPTALTLQQKEKRLSLMREHLGQSLSTEVDGVISRAGSDWKSLERNLNSLIMGDGEATVHSLPNDLGRKKRESVSQEEKQMNDPTPSRPRGEQRGSFREQGGIDNQDFLNLIQRLGLDRYYPRKMGRADFHLIYKTSVHDSQPHTEEELPFYFLQKLLMLDYRLRYLVCEDDGKTTMTMIEPLSPTGHVSNSSDLLSDFFNITETHLAPSDITQTHIHPMDVQMAIFHCADDFTRQYISTKLSICQFALPFLVPKPFSSQIEFPLWSLRQVKKSWRQMETLGEEKRMKNYNGKLICETATPIVSFLRVGNSFFSSKSQILNSLLVNQKRDIFFHRHCRGSSKDVLLMGGVVDIFWYCPGGKDDDSFDNCITFTNLHGDAKEHEAQLRFLQEVSSVTIILLLASEQNEGNRQIIHEFLQSPKPVICLFDDKEKIVGSNCGLKVRIGIKNRNEAELMEELRATITHLLEVQGQFLSPVNCAEIAHRHGFLIDEDQKECKKARIMAQKLVDLLTKKKLSTVKQEFLPLQGDLWHQWCKKDRELSHLHVKGNKNIEQHRSEIEAEKQEIRRIQYKNALSLNPPMRSVVDILQAPSGTNNKLYFLQWLSVFLENLTASHLDALQQKYDGLWSQVLTEKQKEAASDSVKQLQSELEFMSKEINDSKIGIEHFLREIGQIYEAVDRHSPEKDTLMFSLPQIVADLMVAGYPVELMDGDASYVPLKWVAAILDRLTETLGDRKLFVLSVLGLQSSRKSTLLNTMFGLQFTVSAGRCTRGAYMQLLKVEETFLEEVGFDYVLIVDTEGLRAPELANKSLNRDNELATFVIGLGNLTIINIFGENPSEMQDILEIVVQAFLRMNLVRLSPSCVFVHQNVGEIMAKDQNKEGRRRLQQRLDEMAAAAAEQEQIPDITQFSDVIRFDVNTHVHYFAHLWEGNPPMAPPNPSYSHNIQDLKSWILTVAKGESQGRILRLSALKDRIQDLWRALVNENFIFSFRNTREIVAMSKLEAKYNSWTWQLRSHILTLQNDLNNQIQNGNLKVLSACHCENSVSEKYVAIQQDLEKYFNEDEDCEILIQWKANFGNKLQMLKETLVSETKRKTEELITFKMSQSELDKKNSDYENELLDQSRALALSLQDKEFHEEELRGKFDDLWAKWVTKLSSNHPPVTDPKIDLDLENILCNYFKQEHNIVDKIRSISSQETFSMKFSKYVKTNKKYYVLGHKLEEFDKMNINQTTQQIEEAVNEIIDIKEKLRAGYSSSYFHEILRTIDTNVESANSNERYTFTNKYKQDLSLQLCHNAKKRFKNMHQAFTTANHPVNYLESKKEDFFMSFKISCQGAISIRDVADFLWDKVSSALLSTVWDKAAIDLADDIRSNAPAFNGNRSNLERYILISLAEDESFDSYCQYIHSPRDYFKSYIKKQVENYCSIQEWEKLKHFVRCSSESFKADILTAIHESTIATKTGNGSVSMWLDEFCQRLGHRLTLRRGDLKSIEHQEIKDIEFLKEAVIRAVEGPRSPTLQTSDVDWAGTVMAEVAPKIQKMLSDQLSGCWKQCPFCLAICTNTVADHNGDHSVPFHRSEAVNGWSWHKTGNFSIDFCTSAVASDNYFMLSDGRSFPYKTYRLAGGEYATWSITPDMDDKPYWKWFLCHFKDQLEEKYNKRFRDKGEIPHMWRKIHKEEVIADLKKLSDLKTFQY